MEATVNSLKPVERHRERCRTRSSSTQVVLILYLYYCHPARLGLWTTLFALIILLQNYLPVTLYCLVTFDRNFRCGGNWFLLYHSCASKSATHWLVGDRKWSTFSQWKLRPCGEFNILPTRVDGLFIFLAWRPWPHVIARAIETFDTLISNTGFFQARFGFSNQSIVTYLERGPGQLINSL